MTARFERDLDVNERFARWLTRMDVGGWSGRRLGVALGDSPGRGGSHAWAAKLRRWGDTKTGKGGVPRSGVAPRVEVVEVLRRLEIRDRAEPVVAAVPGSAQAAASVGRVAVASGGAVSSGLQRRSTLPSSVRALLVDVRDGAVSPEEAERVLGAIFLGSSSSASSWGTREQIRRASPIVVLRGGKEP